MDIIIRRAEPVDAEAIQKVYNGPKAIWGTLQLPYPSAEIRRKQLAEPPEGVFHLLACVVGEVVGHLGLTTYPHSPRRRHVGALGMAVRDDWQGKGIGTALMQAVVDLADKWLNLSRLELDVYTDNEPASGCTRDSDLSSKARVSSSLSETGSSSILT
jgi:putative acetyltransferase